MLMFYNTVLVTPLIGEKYSCFGVFFNFFFTCIFVYHWVVILGIKMHYLSLREVITVLVTVPEQKQKLLLLDFFAYMKLEK